MPIYFDNTPEFDGQLLRALSYAYYRGADIGECLSTAKHITPKDFESWFSEWFKTAERVYSLAENSHQNNCLVSAKEAYLRASNYYRAATFFMYDTPPDRRLRQIYDKHCQSFAQAIPFFDYPVEPAEIPYEQSTLVGYFYKTDSKPTPRPVIIVSDGYDSTHQEGYFSIGAAALERGYHVLCFDGPGQGHALIKQNLPMRYDWENVIKPVVDFLLKRPDVDPKNIILYGPSWGGYLTGRAAAFEHRLAALIVNPGQFDAMEGVKKALPDISELLNHDPEHLLGKYLGQALLNPMLAAKMKAKMWVHGTDSLIELIKEWRQYNLKDTAHQIKCPTLVMDAENEAFSSGQAPEFFDALTCKKDYVLFSAKEGAGEHCQAGALSLSHQFLFDWLARVLGS